MKLYISLDMEGIAGTFNWKQEDTDRSIVRKWMTQQVEWIISGIKDSTADRQITEILLTDSHLNGDSIFYDITALDDRLHLISGGPRSEFMMAGLDNSFDLVFLVGYHSGIGTAHAVMDHSYTSNFHKIWLNDLPVSEALLNAALAGYFGVPVGLIVGDAALQQELATAGVMPWAHYVVTKTGLARYSAKHRPLPVVRRETVAAVQQLLAGESSQLPLFTFTMPGSLKIEFHTADMADAASLVPGVTRSDGRTVVFEHADYKVIFNLVQVMSILAASVK